MTDDNLTVSDLTLERYQLGELTREERVTVERRVAADAGLRARLVDLVRSDEEFRDGHVAAQLARSVEARTVTTSRRIKPALSSWQWSLMGTAAVMVIAAAAWFPGLREAATLPPATQAPAATDRVKGEAASLLLYRKTEAGSELLDDGATVRSGDLIRVAYRAGAPCFGVIVSIDGAGVVTRHLPVGDRGAAVMQPGDATPLDQAYELDHAPKFERFFLITGDRAFDVQMVIDAARRVAAAAGSDVPAALPLPAGLSQSTFLLRKGL